jgi:hypothetical protein
MLDVAEVPKQGLGGGGASPGVVAGIRPFTVDDIPAVAHLFREIFLKDAKRGTRSLEDTLKREFFEHPWRDPNLPSLVFANAEGGVTGFIGVRPLRLRFNGEPVMAAVCGSLMVDEPARNALTGARLLRSFLNGPQELSVSESANTLSRPMWDKLGGRTEPAYSMDWLRVFKPGGLAVAVATDRFAAARLLRPFAAVFDWCAARVRRNPLRVDTGLDRGVDVDADEIADAILRLSPSDGLRPDWDRESLNWFLERASEKERFGPLVRRVVRDRRGTVVGAYVYCVRARGVALALQIFAEKSAAEDVVDDLIADASRRGAVAVRGRVQPELADILLRRRAVFLHVSSTVVRSKRADLLKAIQAGQATITGLACESWSGLIGGLFL